MNDENLLNLRKVIDVRTKKLSEVKKLTSYLYERSTEYSSDLLIKYHDREVVEQILSYSLNNFNLLESALRSFAQRIDSKPGHVFWPVRIAIMGNPVGLPLFEVVEELGKEEFELRIKESIKKLNGENHYEPTHN